MKNIYYKIIIALCCLLPQTAWGDAVSVTTVRTENMSNPIGLDTAQPHFSWRIESEKRDVLQTEYQIIVASSKELLDKDNGDLWDSGKVPSSSSIRIKYEGKKLKSNQYGWWKVKSFTNKGETKWSESAYFSIGLLSEVNWRGQWIGLDRAAAGDSETTWSRLSSRYLRKEFKLKGGIKRATVHIAGMGMYELFINGKRVGEQVLAPVPTDYRKTIVYNSFDVTSMLVDNNAIGVTLGNGRFYTMRQNYKPYKITNFGYPKLRLNLIVEYQNGERETIITDTSWKLSAQGPIRSNNEYDGEIYDARKEMPGWTTSGYNDSSWSQAERVSIPSGTLRGSMTPNMKVVMTLKPKTIKKIGNKYILDMGQNMAGWIKMTIRNAAVGDSIKLRFAETLQPNGELYILNLRDALVTDKYISNGKDSGLTWAPRFVYHGFRFVEITGSKNPDINDFVGEVVSDEMENLGTFECSNDMLNGVYKNAWWGILDNYKGMPVDCPQRNERQPWLGDRVMGSWGESFLFDNSNLYAKWANDICEAQREDGSIPDVAPAYWNYYSDNMTWPAALPMACDMLYTHFGNIEPIRKFYPNIMKWLEYMRENYMTSDYIVTKDKYGDWCVPPETLDLIHSKDPDRITDGTLIATAYYLKMLQTMHRFAGVLGYSEDMKKIEELEHKVKDAFNSKFLTVKRGTSLMPGHILYPDSIYYGNNTVTANILPLAFGIVPDEYREDVVKNIAHKIMMDKTPVTNYIGHVSCGVIGMQWLMKTLSKYGLSDIAWMFATNDTYPSYGYMAKNGATTIWELWNGNTANPEMNSGNHVMLLGDLLKWCYENIGGIAPDRKEVAFKHIIMKPDFNIQNIYNANVSYITPYGKVTSKWKKTLQKLNWEVTIPANTTATLYMPDGKIEKIGSGTYQFTVAIPAKSEKIVKQEFLYTKSSFPECHASTIVELKNGDLVASFFGGTKEKNPDCCIWVCRKPNGSSEWSEPVIAADGVFSLDDPLIGIAGLSGINEKTTMANVGPASKNFKGDINKARRKACWNPVLFQVPGGDLLLFYKIGSSVGDWTGWLVRSKDGGKSWSQREPLPKGFLGPIKNKPIYLDGRIISPSSTEDNMGWRLHFEISDDFGKTWKMVGPLEAELNLPTALRKSGAVQSDNETGEPIQGKDMQPIFAIQPSILIHKDGRLQILARTRNTKLATSWSSDKGDTWSKVTLSDVPNNNSGTDAVTMKDGRHVLIYNNFETLPGNPKGLRTPLSIAISNDGIDWKHILTLEDSPINQYSYPSIIQGKSGKLHVIYTWRRELIKYAEIDIDK